MAIPSDILKTIINGLMISEAARIYFQKNLPAQNTLFLKKNPVFRKFI
jgi:hypothetical protein